MTRPTQADMFAEVARVEQTTNDLAKLQGARFVVDPAKVAAFDFVPGPETVPRPDWVPPEYLRLPTDDLDWMPTPPSLKGIDRD